jgi:two-component system KDP operon response regulator KdpE
MAIALIVDRDPQTVDVLRIALSARGYEVTTAADVGEALRRAGRARPQVILVDDCLPGIAGPQVIVALRELTTVPIIVMSARSEPDETVRVLDAGADDHITKPFDVQELLARVRAAVRRAATPSAEGGRQIVDTGSFAVDLDTKRVWRDGAEVRLSPNEWRVLEMLVHGEGRLVGYGELLCTIWGPEHDTDTQYLRVYVAQLRRKLEPDPAHPRHLITEYGRGYRFHTYRADTS